jgi:ribosome maturation factor RimP
MELNQKIKEMAAKGLQNPSHFVVDVSVSKYKPTKITVFVDGDQGISIDDCANLSRLLAEQLDEQDLIKEAYTLEVSTPGIDHPLKLKRQYLANIGRNVKVQLTDKELLRGKLMNADEQKIILETQNKEKNKGLMTREILFTDIEKTIVTVSFN